MMIRVNNLCENHQPKICRQWHSSVRYQKNEMKECSESDIQHCQRRNLNILNIHRTLLEQPDLSQTSASVEYVAGASIAENASTVCRRKLLYPVMMISWVTDASNLATDPRLRYSKSRPNSFWIRLAAPAMSMTLRLMRRQIRKPRLTAAAAHPIWSDHELNPWTVADINERKHPDRDGTGPAI